MGEFIKTLIKFTQMPFNLFGFELTFFGIFIGAMLIGLLASIIRGLFK